ncbi:hypothetical protein GCM10023063_48480 [Arthrobacter methylotrophus]
MSETQIPRNFPRNTAVLAPCDPGTQASFGTYGGRPVSFVRRGTRLQGRRQAAWEEHSDRWAVQVPRHVANTSVHPDYVFDAEAEFGREAPLIVEIGSGLGDAVCHAAEENPDKDFLAVEVYTPGLANTMIKINSRGLSNVRVVEANAPEVLATMLPAARSASCGSFSRTRGTSRGTTNAASSNRRSPNSRHGPSKRVACGGSPPTGPTTPFTSAKSSPAPLSLRTCTTASGPARKAPYPGLGIRRRIHGGRGPRQGRPRTGQHRTYGPQ